MAIVAPGLPFATVLRALADLGLTHDDLEELGVRLVRIGMAWPIEPLPLRELVAGVGEVLVVEDKTAFVESQLKEALYRQPHQPMIVGHSDEVGRPLIPVSGAVTAEMVATLLGRRLALPDRARHWLQRIGARERLTLHVTGEDESAAVPPRAPFFCSGCPHNISTRADADQLVGIGIGCHIMVALHEKGRGHQVGMTQMGGEGAQWIGLAPFTDDRHYFQNLGDGTFFHSGSLAVRAAVAADAEITYKLLFNHAVAMTGGQNPTGAMDVRHVVDLLAAEGVRKIVVTTADPAAYRRIRLHPVATVRHRDDLPAIQRELAETPGVSVLLHDDWCAAEERRLRRRGTLPTPNRRIWINERVCEGCGDCVAKATCLSLVPVETEYGRKTAVDQNSCNLDYSCVRGDCPSFLEVIARPTPVTAAEPPLEPAEPHLRVGPSVLIRMPGVGGTGVVTVSRILQMAAHLSGRFSLGVEQTGLAQKYGPVVSDVRISPEEIEGTPRASNRTADVLLGFDLFGAADASNLSVCDPERTVPVVNTAQVPTVPLAQDPMSHFPRTAALVTRIEREAVPDSGLFLDADWIAGRLHLASNMVLLGAAYQHGCLPVPAGAIEAAIVLNGVAPADNVRAFRWGRAAAADPDAVHRALAPPVPATIAPADLVSLVAARAEELVAYQGPRYAQEYRAAVESVADAERSKLPGTRGAPVRAGVRGRAVQADGLQGRVRGGPAAPRHGAAGAPRGHLRAAAQGEGAAAPAGAAGPRPPPQAPPRAERRPGLPGASGRPAAPRHPLRPLRQDRHPEAGAAAPGRVPGPRGVGPGPPRPGHRRGGGGRRRAPRPRPGLRVAEGGQRHPVPRPGGRAPGRARRDTHGVVPHCSGVRRGERCSRIVGHDPSLRGGHMPTVAEIASDYIDEMAAADPIDATSWGLPGHDDRLPDLSPSGLEARAEIQRRTLAALATAESAGDGDRIAARVMAERLESGLLLHDSGDELRALRVIHSPQGRVRQCFDLMRLESEDDWQVAARRMRAVPVALAGLRETLEEGLARKLPSARRQVLACAAQCDAWGGGEPVLLRRAGRALPGGSERGRARHRG